MGCGQCYETFADQLGPLLRKVHSATEHTGKTPKRAAGPLKLKREIQALRRELQAAVAEEDFERAAQLRDRIRELETKVQPASTPAAESATRPAARARPRRKTEEGSS